MLHFYDRVKSTSLLAFAAAGGLLIAPLAAAEAACTPRDGYATDLAAYVAEVETCIAASEAVRPGLEADLAEQTNFARASLGLSKLERRASLDTAARAHALDMAARDYTGHADLEGRDHAFRMGVFDRSMLVGASGANIVTLGADADAAVILSTMGQDVQNAKNVVHEWFTDFGIGVVQANDRTRVVVLFAAVEGELDEALPLALSGQSSLYAELKRDLGEAVGWSLQDYASGDTLGQGASMSLRNERVKSAEAAGLRITVDERADLYELRGPVLSTR